MTVIHLYKKKNETKRTIKILMLSGNKKIKKKQMKSKNGSKLNDNSQTSHINYIFSII